MKDYYQILGVPESASPEEIKRAFRRLAFEHHPDKNPGNEAQAEQRFKEINEAYCVLGNELERQEYDAFRRGQFVGAGYSKPGSFQYSQEDIFRYTFSNRDILDELSKMFGQAGLRFDADFLNRVFFSKKGFVFQFHTGPNGSSRTYYNSGEATPYGNGSLFSEALTRPKKPSLIERLAAKIANKMMRYALKKLLGLELRTLSTRGADLYEDLTLSAKEAASGCEKRITYKRGKEKKRIMVKVPPGVITGIKIRLKGMGLEGQQPGDLYLCIKVKK